jgi:hypothetical protein
LVAPLSFDLLEGLMANITREERLRREAVAREEADRRLNDAKADPNATAWEVQGLSNQAALDDLNARDERRPDWRPSTLVNIETQEPAPDNRGIPGDLGKAVNIMAQQAVVVETDPSKLAQGPLEIVDPKAPAPEGTKVRLLKGYQPPAEKEGDPLPPKRMPGEVIGLPASESKRLLKRGVVRRLEDE